MSPVPPEKTADLVLEVVALRERVRDAEALADEWTREAERIQEFADRHQGYYLGVVGTMRNCRDHLRAILAAVPAANTGEGDE